MVVAHVLVNQSALDVHGFVFWQLLHDLSKLIERFIKVACPSEHQTLVKHRAYETHIALQSIAETSNCTLDQPFFLLEIP